MERVRIGVEASEIIDFDAPFFLFPVRHHSPVCSYHLKSVIKRYRPEIILIEGPENANDLIPVLTDERTSLPAAIYYYYKDKKKYISDDAQDYKCYYPFLYSSPEYNAIKAAKELGIKAEFIDLPYSEILINTAKGRGLLENEKRTIADDTKLAKGDFYKALCDKTGIRDFDEFWEKYFEISGLFESDEEFLAALHTYCLISRRQTSTEEMTADATLAREEYMAANISEALKVHKKVLVVTGGFHSYGLYERLKRGGEFKKKKLHIVPADCTGCFPAAYSYEAADAMKGYSSGMRAPFFYDSVYRKLEESAEPDGVYDDLTLEFLIKGAKACKERDIAVSIADVTAAETMKGGLAALRGIRESGLYELFDAVTSTFIKGEKNLSSSVPVELVSKLLTGDGVGHIGDSSHTPPLIADFEAQCTALGLRADTAVPQEVDAALFTTKKGLPLSRFMHRMKFLETGFAKRLKGPDLTSGRDRNRVREIWKYRRSPAVDSALIDHTTDGFTIEEACINLAAKRLLGERRAESAAVITVDCFLMGISVDDDLTLVTNILASDGDFFSVGTALYYFQMLYDLQSIYRYQGVSIVSQINTAFSKLISALPTLADIPDEQADGVIRIMRQMYDLTGGILTSRRDELFNSLITLTNAGKKHPAVYGCAMGLLYAFDAKYQHNAELAMQGYLNGALSVKKQGADYLRGLFTAARDIVFSDNDFLRMTDKLITNMDSDDFMEILPSLRLAFAAFTPREIQHTAAAVAELYDMDNESILDKKAVDEGLFIFGRALDDEIMKAIEGGA